MTSLWTNSHESSEKTAHYLHQMTSTLDQNHGDQRNFSAKKTPKKPLEQSRSRYRPEIDGLRAIAVIAVIVNHFNADLLPSGFLGVDIFFVISGFVVTSSLSNKTGLSWKAYLLTFYARRIKRLVPALVACVVITGIIGCLFVEDPRTSLRTGLAALIGASNLYLLRESTDYFGQSGELNLFTQTWSLGVEEQFYLVFPILLGLCGFSRQKQRQGSRNLFLSVLALSVLSLIGYLHLAQSSLSSAFFLMPTRFWELGIGCLVFLSSRYLYRYPLSQLKALIAPVSTLLLVGLLFLSQSFQVAATLSTVLLTCLLLWAFEHQNWLVKLFSVNWMVQIGLLSYSLYLWHWSVLVISRWTVGVSKWTVPVQLALIVGLAIASNQWIEKPLRYARWSPGQLKTIGYGLSATATSAAILVALAIPLKGELFLGNSFPNKTQRTFTLSRDYRPCSDVASVAADFSKCTYSRADSSTEVPLATPVSVSPSVPTSVSASVPVSVPISTSPAPATTQKTVYFVGDSHTTSLLALASRLVETKDFSRVTTVARSGCFFSDVLVREPLNEPTDAGCQQTNQAFWSELSEKANAGDVVVVTMRYQVYFLSPNHPESLRDWESGSFNLTEAGKRVSKEEALLTYQKELVDVSNQLAQKGISLVVQAPLPDWKHYPHECQPQWYRPNVLLPATCELDVAAESQKRSPVLETFRTAEADADHLHVYDPFPVFCNSDRCVPFLEDGTPLFLDYNHLNNYGAEYVYKDFVQFLADSSLLAGKL